MLLIRYVDADGQLAIGRRDADGIRPFSAGVTLAELLRLPLDAFRAACEAPGADPIDAAAVRLLPPIDGHTEVWAAGVTYKRSREARVEESTTSADVYEQVYVADRPELFFKSAAWRVTGDGEQVSVRADSEISVPEPELALIINGSGEIVGYSVCNDCSSRSIEGQNPLYLPQAKVFLGGCALGPGIRPVWEIDDPYGLGIAMTITRDDAKIWDGTASTAELNRRLDDLAQYLHREDVFPDGVVLSTGTSLVPDLPFTLVPGDVVRVAVEQVGVLTSEVVAGKAALGWLAGALRDPARDPAQRSATSAATR